MAWGVGGAVIVLGLYQATAEQMFPNSIDDRVREARVVRRREPRGEFQAAVDAFRLLLNRGGTECPGRQWLAGLGMVHFSPLGDPDRPAIIEVFAEGGSAVLTFGGLRDASNRLANALRRAGIF